MINSNEITSALSSPTESLRSEAKKLENTLLGERNRTQKEKYCIISLTCGIFQEVKYTEIENGEIEVSHYKVT
jgi:hypothetical protein